MTSKLLPVYLLFICQCQLWADETVNQTEILWSTVSPSGTYALAAPNTISKSSDGDPVTANGKPGTELSIVNLQTNEPVLDFSGFEGRDFAQLDAADACSTHSFCAWAPQEDHLLVVSALEPLACRQVDLPDGHVSNIGSTLVAAATRIAKGSTTRKPSFSTRSPHLSIIDAHFISSHECYVTINIDSGSGSDARRVDVYFQINSGANSLVFERSEPYPNPNQPLGASILASRQVERVYQTLRGVLNEGDRQLLTIQQQSWLGGREMLDNYEDRVAFAQTRLTELRQRLKEALQKKSTE